MPNRPLKIAMVSLHTSPTDSPGSGDAGGMNVVEYHAAQALAALGHSVDLITRRSDPAQPDCLELALGVRLRHLDAGPAERLAKSAIDQYIPQFRAALAQLALTLGAPAVTPYDIIHSQHWMSGVAALPLARDWGIPHVQSYHSVAALPGSALSAGEPPESPARVAGEALIARQSDLIVAISAAETRTVIERCGASADRVAIVAPGVDTTLFHPRGLNPPGHVTKDGTSAYPSSTPAAIKTSHLVVSPGATGAGVTVPGVIDIPIIAPERYATHGRGYIVFAARLQPLKAPDLAIAALAHVAEPIRPDLVLAGADSPDFADYAAYLTDLTTELGLSDYVHLVGPQERVELAALLRQARLCLVPSHSETFGLIALEAAASGTPVIAAAAGGLREAVVHGETGQLMDSRQPEDWGVALTKLLSCPGLTTRMGTIARVHARRFTWSAMATELSRLYESLLAA